MCFYLMALIGLAVILPQGHAAEISVLPNNLGIILKGQIVIGDYERFTDILLRGNFLNELTLESRGGDAIEAMRIGRLVRESRMGTSVSMGDGNKAVCRFPARIGNLKECSCLSSCFLIFVAGIEREGNTLGIHRVFVDHQRLKQMTPDEAAALSGNATNLVSSYLKEMGVPTHFVERLMAIPSDKLEWVSNIDVKRYFSGYIPEYSEWVAAKCPSKPDSYYVGIELLQAKKNKKQITSAEEKRLNALWSALSAEITCSVNAKFEIQEQARLDVRAKLKSNKTNK